MKLEELKGKKILILGFGKEGKSTLKFLKSRLPDLKVDYTDKTLDKNYLQKQKNYNLVIKTPGIPRRLVTVPYTTATNLFFANIDNKIIGVTGSKGKSTTSSLIHEFLNKANLKSHLIGNIGSPMLEELLRPVSKKDILVVELSSYQLDDIGYSPHISVILNLFPEHMDYHNSIANYFKAKKNILNQLKKNDYFIYNSDYPLLKKWADGVKCKTIPFNKYLDLDSKNIILKGDHNLANIAAAVAVAKIFKIPDQIVRGVIKSFKPLLHRLEFIGTFNNIKFYDDAISTTPESTIAAIKTLPNIGTLLLGGQNRGYDFHDLITVIEKYRIKNLVLFPDSGQKIMSLLKIKNKQLLRIFQTNSMEKAVKFAYENTPTGSICLLSTASPSYSLWKNFEEKGNLFQFFVRKYSKSN